MTRKTRSARGWFFSGTLLALVAGGVFVLTADPQTPEPALAGSSAATPSTPEASGNRQAIPNVAAPSGPADPAEDTLARTPASLGAVPFAPSLAGTDIDGALKADANGALIVDLETRDFFDYFLSTVGEVSPETAIGQIEQMARNHLPEPAASQALALLDDYLAYKQAALGVMQSELDPARAQDPAYQLTALGNALADLKALRQSTFSSPAHQAFFGLEEAYSEYTLASLGIQQRQDLSDDGKQALIDYHRDQLPEVIRRTEERLHQEVTVQRQRVDAISSADSPEAAGEKLAELGLDAQSVKGVTDYLKQRQRFDASFATFEQALSEARLSGLATDDQRQHREALLKQHFPDEQTQTWARLRLLDNS
ncbi:MAG: lipase chaperone [Marinobacter sp. 34-60-7]|nr:MAG: lipase chaperone [Marinobacter sp. 34-60-7]